MNTTTENQGLGVTMRDLWTLIRPKGAWLIALIPVAGYGYGLWEVGSTQSLARSAPTMALLFSSWFLGHSGTMWLNADLDRDEGDVLFGQSAPVPAIVRPLGYVTLMLSVSIAFALGTTTATCSLLCALLAILYSHPSTQFKGHAWAGPLVNLLGYGVITPLAGLAIIAPPINLRLVWTFLIINLLIFGAYVAAQAFQEEEDRNRGYRTFVVLFGPRQTLRCARIVFVLATLLVLTACIIGFYPRITLLSAPFFLWIDRLMARWIREPKGGSAAWGMLMVKRVCITCIIVLLTIYAHHFYRLSRHLPGGGQGTAWRPLQIHSPLQIKPPDDVP